jgi:hypothetical protein
MVNITREQIEINALKNHIHPTGWIWDEYSKSYFAPVEPPNDNRPYLWNEVSLSWELFPGYDAPPSSINLTSKISRKKWKFVDVLDG